MISSCSVASRIGLNILWDIVFSDNACVMSYDVVLILWDIWFRFIICVLCLLNCSKSSVIWFSVICSADILEVPVSIRVLNDSVICSVSSLIDCGTLWDSSLRLMLWLISRWIDCSGSVIVDKSIGRVGLRISEYT